MSIGKQINPKWFTVAGILWIVVGLVSILPTLLLFFLFYIAPHSRNNPLPMLFFGSLVSFPIICIGSSPLIWLLKRKHENIAFYISLLPAFFLVLVFATYIGFQVFCDGNFNCQKVFRIQEQDNAVHASECLLPVLDGGDGFATTGCGALKVGVIGTGTTNSISEANNWQFSAQNGKQIKITIENDGKSCSQIYILDANGSVIEGFEDENHIQVCPEGLTTTSFYYFKSPADGTYIIRLITPKTPGGYWLKVE